MGLWSGCAEGETNFSCGIHFNIKEICPMYAYHPGLSDPGNKIKHRNHVKCLIKTLSKMCMGSFRDENLKRNTFSCFDNAI